MEQISVAQDFANLMTRYTIVQAGCAPHYHEGKGASEKVWILRRGY